MKKSMFITASVLVITLTIVLTTVPVELTAFAAEDGSIEIGGYIAAAPSDPISCYIKYDANGGTGSYEGSDIAPGETDTILSPDEAGISRAGYHFTGWNSIADGGGAEYVPGDSLTLNDKVILYAQWTSVPEKQASNQTNVSQTSSSSSKTGDESNIVLWISAFSISFVLLIAVWIVYKRSKRAENQSKWF